MLSLDANALLVNIAVRRSQGGSIMVDLVLLLTAAACYSVVRQLKILDRLKVRMCHWHMQGGELR